MTDRAQFEAMLNALINEDQDAAKEIFHNIVVAKSREIYEELLAEDFDVTETSQEGEPAMDGGMEEAAEDDSEDTEADEGDDEGADNEFGGEEEGDDEEGEEDPFGGEEESDSEMDDSEQTDRILDLEDALEELKAEFEQLMAGDEGGEEMPADMGGDDMGADMGGDDMGAAEFGGDELEGLMEYVNKVGGNTYNTFGKMGDDGANTKSIVAGKNDMGGTSANIAQSFSTTTGGTQGGLAKPTAGDLTSGLGTVHNRVDSKAGKTAFTKKEPGHGAEKAGAKETADNKQSVLKAIKK